MNINDQSVKTTQEYLKRFWVYYDHAVECCEADPKHPTAVFNNVVGMGCTLLQLEQQLGIQPK